MSKLSRRSLPWTQKSLTRLWRIYNPTMTKNSTTLLWRKNTWKAQLTKSWCFPSMKILLTTIPPAATTATRSFRVSGWINNFSKTVVYAQTKLVGSPGLLRQTLNTNRRNEQHCRTSALSVQYAKKSCFIMPSLDTPRTAWPSCPANTAAQKSEVIKSN